MMGIGMGRLGGFSALGQSYSDMSWSPPSQSSPGGYFGDGSINQPGTAANALLNQSPDGTTPVGSAVMDAFSGEGGQAQPGVLAINPNATANSLSFVQPPQQSTQCEIINTINGNPWWLLVGTGLVFYFASYGTKTYKARKARKAAK
jgi:hypothetical protein